LFVFTRLLSRNAVGDSNWLSGFRNQLQVGNYLGRDTSVNLLALQREAE
jgi:hypothetical protein